MDAKFGKNAKIQSKMYASDIETIVAKRFDNGADFWATPDKKIYKGAPFSTLECLLMLFELELTPTTIMKSAAELMLGLWRNDGRFQIAPKTAIYPCHTANVARVLCRLGYANDSRLLQTFDHLLQIQHTDGGWRCNTYKYGRGPETEFSNPGTTLAALDAYRFSNYLNTNKCLDNAVESLLNHWETRKPLGPCQYGMGSLFMKVEYPFFRYNLFFYVYVLSFYNKAKNDSRFLAALKTLKSKLVNGQIIIENPNSKLANLSFCKKGKESELATLRFEEILKNVNCNSLVT